MKKAVGWALSWSLYWVGDLVSRIVDLWPWERFHPYPIYNRLMNWSSAVQDWSGSGPWIQETLHHD